MIYNQMFTNVFIRNDKSYDNFSRWSFLYETNHRDIQYYNGFMAQIRPTYDQGSNRWWKLDRFYDQAEGLVTEIGTDWLISRHMVWGSVG